MRKFKTESKKLLDLMINSIYTNKEIFLRELISNASDAVDKLYFKSLTDQSIGISKDDLEIDVDFDKESRTITISDTGIGMTPEVQKHVFDKFYQGDISHKKKGSGLGLALVKRIVSLHNGNIRLESVPDLGSTFTVRLPAEHPDTSS